jgi:DNA-binding MarR family transcriptional regulator
MMKPIHNVSTSSSAVLEKLWGLTLLLSGHMAAGLEERRLTLARAGLMWELQAREPVTQRELSQVLGVTPRNVTGLVDALEADGLVERSPHPQDRRATLVRLSQEGNRIAAQLRQEQDHFASQLFGDLSERDRAFTAALLDLLIERIRTAMAGGGQPPEPSS